MRVDLFSMIHKGLRTLLFDLATEAARVDLTSTPAIDLLAGRIEHVLQFLDEHARIEDTFVVPAVRAFDAKLADELGAGHRALEVVQIEVERAASALEQAKLAGRSEAGAQLIRIINHLVAVQLIHMNLEETEVNERLWAGLHDTELGALRTRMAESLSPERATAWRSLLEVAISPVERRLVLGGLLR